MDHAVSPAPEPRRASSSLFPTPRYLLFQSYVDSRYSYYATRRKQVVRTANDQRHAKFVFPYIVLHLHLH